MSDKVHADTFKCIFYWVELNVATVATFNTQNVATLRNFNPPPGLRFAC